MNEKQWCQPPIKPLVTRFVQRVKALIALIPFCGVWQRKILARLDQWICLLTCDGGVIGAEIVVTDSMTVIREREIHAKKTYVTNKGANVFKLYEDGALVRVLYPNTLWESPTTGQMQITGMCAPGLSSIAAVATEKRCQCGIDDYLYYGTTEPIGGILI